MDLFETEYKILSADCDRHGFWRPDSVMVLMQELSGEHSHLLGWGRENTLAAGAVWVLTRHEMVIDRYPLIAQTVRCRTFPGRPRRGIYPRYYLIQDAQGRPLARGSSFWALADIHTRGMTDLPQVAASMPDTSGIPLPLPNPSAADEVRDGLERALAWRPRYTDIDRNGHVNNTRAADLALCFLGETVPIGKTPVRHIKVSYSREILQDSQVDCASA